MMLAPSVIGPGDGLLNREVVAASVRAADLVGEDAGIGRDADDALRFGWAPRRVVHGSGDGSGDVRAVTVIVHRVAVAEDEVVAARVVGCQVRVRVIDAGVDHRHRDVGAALQDVPGLRRIDVRVGRAGIQTQLAAKRPRDAVERLPGVVESPLFVEVVVTRYDRRPHRERWASVVGG